MQRPRVESEYNFLNFLKNLFTKYFCYDIITTVRHKSNKNLSDDRMKVSKLAGC